MVKEQSKRKKYVPDDKRPHEPKRERETIVRDNPPPYEPKRKRQ